MASFVRGISLVGVVGAMFVSSHAAAQAATQAQISPTAPPTACVPDCRAGYICVPDGRCVSPCNPPCPETQACVTGAARPDGAASYECAPAAPAPSMTVPPVAPPSEVPRLNDVMFAAQLSLGSFAGVFTLMPNVELTLGNEHAFYVSVRLPIFIGTNALVGFGAGAGYRYRAQTSFGELGVGVGLAGAGSVMTAPNGAAGFYGAYIEVAPFVRAGIFFASLTVGAGVMGVSASATSGGTTVSASAAAGSVELMLGGGVAF